MNTTVGGRVSLKLSVGSSVGRGVGSGVGSGVGRGVTGDSVGSGLLQISTYAQRPFIMEPKATSASQQSEAEPVTAKGGVSFN